jgi:hypothetical protein
MFSITKKSVKVIWMRPPVGRPLSFRFLPPLRGLFLFYGVFRGFPSVTPGYSLSPPPGAENLKKFDFLKSFKGESEESRGEMLSRPGGGSWSPFSPSLHVETRKKKPASWDRQSPDWHSCRDTVLGPPSFPIGVVAGVTNLLISAVSGIANLLIGAVVVLCRLVCSLRFQPVDFVLFGTGLQPS